MGFLLLLHHYLNFEIAIDFALGILPVHLLLLEVVNANI
jgi:hypothetical protein